SYAPTTDLYTLSLHDALPISGTPALLKGELECIETQCGRSRDAPKWAPRAMDLDILLFGDVVQDVPGLVLPRPDLLRWAFMLGRSEEHTSELQSQSNLVCRLL